MLDGTGCPLEARPVVEHVNLIGEESEEDDSNCPHIDLLCVGHDVAILFNHLWSLDVGHTDVRRDHWR